MITLTRLSGSVFVLNSDLIERIDATPDTVVSLVDGKKYVVSETLDEVVTAVRAHRGEIIALSAIPPRSTPLEDHDQPRRLASVAPLPSLEHGRGEA